MMPKQCQIVPNRYFSVQKFVIIHSLEIHPLCDVSPVPTPHTTHPLLREEGGWHYTRRVWVGWVKLGLSWVALRALGVTQLSASSFCYIKSLYAVQDRDTSVRDTSTKEPIDQGAHRTKGTYFPGTLFRITLVGDTHGIIPFYLIFILCPPPYPVPRTPPPLLAEYFPF